MHSLRGVIFTFAPFKNRRAYRAQQKSCNQGLPFKVFETSLKTATNPQEFLKSIEHQLSTLDLEKELCRVQCALALYSKVVTTEQSLFQLTLDRLGVVSTKVRTLLQ